ncbi:MAG: DUF2235 domain-containing protein [Pseudohongiellaceae bacterium]|nr:DUF2235 domain-containing protein [Pseudohongiellaceae bacterium]
MKRIVIFADGTWNSPEQGGATNILHMTRAIKPVATNSVEQIAFYDWGVGTDRKELMGGMAGEGIDKNIQDCYRFLVHNYKKGDEIYLFGFSRGSYTVRSLGGFIRNCGLLKREHASRIPEAYELYRNRSKRSAPNTVSAKEFRQNYAVADKTKITFMGVFDTVGALGIPVPFWGNLGKAEFLFHDTEPSSIVEKARHAVSIDENREDFAPTLWDDKEGIDLKQVWFAGVHCDVGGGYKEGGLSGCAMKWMLKEAKSSGLQFEPHINGVFAENPLDKAHDEFKSIYKLRGKRYVRDVKGPLHVSVKARLENDQLDYGKKSKAMRKLLKSVNGDLNQLHFVN